MFLMGLLTPTMIVIRSYNEVNIPTVTLLAKTLRAVRQQKLQITSLGRFSWQAGSLARPDVGAPM